jgi:hypothetical protein
VLHDGAPFAVVRWTNLWFPSTGKKLGFFRDYFGGPLRPLFGDGILDIPVEGNLERGWKRWIPGYAHALYFKFPDDRNAGSVTHYLDTHLALGDFHLPPTGKQISYALDLLRHAGLSTTRMSPSHTELIDEPAPGPEETVGDWLHAMTRFRMSGLIATLKEREENTPTDHA